MIRIFVPVKNGGIGVKSGNSIDLFSKNWLYAVMNRSCIYFFLLVVFFASTDCYADSFGPRDNPEGFLDFGGTPDLVLSGDVGVSAEEISGLLEKLHNDNLERRIAAVRQIKQNAAGGESVLKTALWDVGFVRHSLVKEAIKRGRANAQGNGAGALLGGLLQQDQNDESVRLATKVVVILVALHHLDTMAGYKVILDFSGRHAGAFRAFIGELLVGTGLKVLPALIYGRGSNNQELHMFSVTWIRDMGNPLLSQQIQGIRNTRRLAQLLEAYASVNELDAIDVTLSSANHESIFVRNAARACLAAYGKNAKWSIFREYENTFEKEPPAEKSYEHWALALYAYWDSQREAQIKQLIDKAHIAATQADYKTMDAIYRKLLADRPLLPRRDEMAKGYLAYATALEKDGEHELALVNYRMIKRLADKDGPTYSVAGQRLLWLHTELMRQAGALDIESYQQFAQGNEHKVEAQKWIQFAFADVRDESFPVLRAVGVSMLLFAGLLLVYWRIRLQGQKD